MAPYFMRSADDLVPDGLRGLAAARAGTVRLNTDPRYLLAIDPDPGRRVGLVSGGGSGHEPMHGGLVGRGLLDAAVPGEIFASPHNRQIYEASRAAAKEAGVLHIVKNYTGDIINFGIARERLAMDGIACAELVVDDDLATDDPEILLGRRGTGATVLVEKILGAAADQGAGLEELRALGRAFLDRTRSVAVANRFHTGVRTGTVHAELGDGELEYGVGIHGERSGETIDTPRLTDLLARMTDELINAVRPAPGAPLLLFVNGLGATTELELFGVFGLVAGHVADLGHTVSRNLVGPYVTALDMSGFSLTLSELDERTTALWDASAGPA
ncbi:dihydroxyacetone kinase subunit DhaK [Nonomuraea sp. NPDC050153]|uniref:dihydroxyacetone kinase subunit DhaK n=1 Tax=Nonomuraea sp. NPDC050153 TaxID=3364359 RepID=UPI0037B6DF0F